MNQTKNFSGLVSLMLAVLIGALPFAAPEALSLIHIYLDTAIANAAFLHKEARVGNGRVEVRDVIERIKGGDRTPDGAVPVSYTHLAC